MKIDDLGHITSTEGKTTEPRKTPYWVGDNNQRIAFDFMVLQTGEVVLHSIYGSVEERLSEDFIYEVVERNKAVASAVNLVNCAITFLQAKGMVGVPMNAIEFAEDVKLTLSKII